MSGIGFLCKRVQRLASCERRIHSAKVSNKKIIRHENNMLQKELSTLGNGKFPDYLQRQMTVWKKAESFWRKLNIQKRVQAERVDKTFSFDFIMSHLRK